MRIAVESKIEQTPRALQAASLFDLDIAGFSKLVWDVTIPHNEKPWNIGLITGPSGCGKSTIARRWFHPEANHLWDIHLPHWPETQTIIDGFPPEMSVKEITALLSAVGFSSPPAWLRPYHVLSTGQKFRADLAKLLAHGMPANILLCDEFTSVVDRTVAKVGSAAVAKTIRTRNLRFVAVSCHEDIIDWLQPDWVYRPDANSFAWRSLQRRPDINLEIVRTSFAAWPLFSPHHYLSNDLNKSAVCFLAIAELPGHDPTPAAFSAWLPYVGGGPPARREHRTVVLPDFQGIGIGMRFSSVIASAWTAIGIRATSTTTHPAFINARKRSPNWRMTRPPSLSGIGSIRGKKRTLDRKLKHASTRLTAGFEYIGPQMDTVQAQKLIYQ